MSSLIKSSRIVLGNQHIKISSEVTKPPIELASDHENASFDQSVNNHTKLADKLIEDAENAALAILDQAESEAEEILKNARKGAQKIEQEALEKASVIYDKNREEGQENGFSQGFDAGQSEAQVLIDEALMIKEEWLLKKKEFIHNLETEMIDLCIKTVENVINKEIKDPAYILDIIKKGIDHLTYAASMIVRVSEYDYDYAASNKSKVLAMLDGVEHIEVRKDLSLNYGECVIDTESGSTDVGISSQMEQVKTIFNALLASE